MKFPPLVKINDKVRIVAPSGIVKEEGLKNAIETLKGWGLTVEIAKNVFEQHYAFSAADEHRFQDLQNALEDDSVSLVLCARGGYGLTRILDSLSFDTYERSPKWLIGFSDITAFLQRANNLGIATIHGPMGTSFARQGAEESIEALKLLLFEGVSEINAMGSQLRIGKASAPMVGGNLALICDSIGTTSELETKDKILVLEDIGEHYYRIDRMLTQLFRAGKLSQLKGLVLGSFSSMVDNGSEFGESVIDMVNRLTVNYNYPIAVNVPIGHEPANFPFVHGGEYRLEVNSNDASLRLTTQL